MTATPISLKDKDKDKAIENGIDFYSMDDEKFFGDEIFKITFRQAINQRPPLLTNYQVYAIAIEDDPSIKEKVIIDNNGNKKKYFTSLLEIFILKE